MDKRMVSFLADSGWVQAKIARRFGVNRSLVCRFLALIKRPKDDSGGITKCEICNNQIKKKHYIEISGVSPFLVCGKCRIKFQENY